MFHQAVSSVSAAETYCSSVSVTSISEDDVIKAGKTTDSIRISDEFGGGFMASVEVNHQLHCLVRSPKVFGSITVFIHDTMG